MLMKRIVSMVLLLSLVFGMLPATAQAAENQATLDTTNTTIEGTNSFGTLLSQDLQQEQTEETNPQIALYNVIDLTVENGMVTAEFYTQKEAELVVAVYTEDEQQLLVSGKTVVQPEETTASVLLEGELPEYFVLSAYLLDPFDYAPLCEAYSTPMYTREMQQLLDSTVDDYDPDRVLNLDEDKTTNFAVYAENIKVIDFVPGVNTVVSADDENAVYVIKNTDANITGLRRGDIMAYTYGHEQILLVKVAKVMVSGTTVTIIGDPLQMEDVFAYVKIEQTGDAADLEVDESTIEEGIVYEGTWQESDKSYPDDYTATGEEPLSYPDSHLAAEGDVTWENYLYFRFVDKKIDHESKYFEAAAKFNGDIGISLDVKVSYYIALTKFFLKYDMDAGIKTQFTASGEAKGKLPLPEFKLSFFGTSIGFEPELQLEFKGEAECTIFLGAKFGFSARVIFGVHIFQSPYSHTDADVDIKAEATVFFGVDLAPQLDVLGGLLAKVEWHLPVGYERKATLDSGWVNHVNDDAEMTHSCKMCIKGEDSIKAELSAKWKLFNSEKLSWESKLKDIEINFGEWYWSIDHNEKGPGKCPYKSYRVTVYVEDAQEEPVAEALISAVTDDGEQTVLMGQTDSNGIAVAYLPPANYVFKASVKGEAYETTETVEEACKVSISMDDTLLGSGSCGEHVEWALFSDGLLRIYGWGEMYDYDSVYNKIYAPWFSMNNKINEVLIEEGVTSIGNCAFHGCGKMLRVTIPASITYIGEFAFYCGGATSVYISDLMTWCNIRFGLSNGNDRLYVNPMYSGAKLYLNGQLVTDLVIPDGVSSVGQAVFSGCTSLTSVTIPEGVTSIGAYAFRNCVNLTSVNIPNGVETIALRAFYGCAGLTDINLPNSVSTIKEGAFSGCTSLTRITLPKQLNSISKYMLMGCSRLAEITIPDSVKSIGTEAFGYCSSLTSVTIPDEVATIGIIAFAHCSGLKSVTIGEACGYIGPYAFAGCSNLREVIFRGNMPTFDSGPYYNQPPFYGVTATAYYPADNDSWGGMGNWNLTWVAYEPGTMAPAEAAPEELLVETPLQVPEEVLSESVASPEDAAATGTVRTASFAELNPGESYVLLVLAAAAAEDMLAPENLLYIDQAAAEQDGTLTFSYIQRVETEDAFVMLCGATDRDLQDARTTFPEMEPSDTLQVVDPTVVLGDKVLVEGQDYVITGTVDYTALGVYTCCVRGINHYTGAVSCTYRVGDPAALFATDTGGCYYTTVAEALQQGDGTVSLVKQVREDLTVSCNTVLDLNGYTLDGSVTAAAGMLTVKDSQTDDFTVEDDYGYGRITGTLTGAEPAEGYVMLTDSQGVSFHRVELRLTDMILRPAVAGVYYKCSFAGDEMVAQNVTQYGVALSVEGDPATMGAAYVDFSSGSNTVNSVLLTGIMKTGNTQQDNARNAEMAVYGSVYMVTKDGQHLFGSCVSRSLRQQVELIDLQWGQLSDLQREAVLSMYRTYASVMQSWQIPNILSAQAAG